MPFSEFPLSRHNAYNARKQPTPPSEDAQLKSSIKKVHSLLNNLVVTCSDDQDSPWFHIFAGGRRYRTIKALFNS
ncbi:MAG: ParB N-terminal domain-containing protein [Alphaproteobacteria bacterium]|nr:ParB N-terminal domain-containing protein [Alphaproteobacteria bacterium]